MISITETYGIETDADNFSVMKCRITGENSKIPGEVKWDPVAHYPLIISGGFFLGLTHAKMYIFMKEIGADFSDFSDVNKVIAKADEVFQAIKAADMALHDEVYRVVLEKEQAKHKKA